MAVDREKRFLYNSKGVKAIQKRTRRLAFYRIYEDLIWQKV